MGDPSVVLNADFLGTGLSIRQIGVLALCLVCIISVIMNAIYGRPGRALCGAPLRGTSGRCRRPLAAHGEGCGIHPASWALWNSLGMILIAAALSLLLLNLEHIIPWLAARITRS